MAVNAWQSWKTRTVVKAGTACPSVISPSPAPAIDEIESARVALDEGLDSASPGRNAGKAKRMDLDSNGVRNLEFGHFTRLCRPQCGESRTHRETDPNISLAATPPSVYW